MNYLIRKYLNWRKSRYVARNWPYFDEYLANCTRQNKSADTLKNYSCDLQKFLNWISINRRMHISKTKSQTLGAYLQFLRTGGSFEYCGANYAQKALGPNSIRRHTSCLNNFFEFLKETYEETGKFKINPIKKHLHFIKLKETDVEHTKYLCNEDWSKILENIKRTRNRLVVKLMYFGGLRVHELTKLKSSNFNHEIGLLTLERKGGRRHKLVLRNWDEIQRDLNHYIKLRELKDDDYLFTSKMGRPLSKKSIYNLVIKVFRNAGCEKGLSPHSFRKACATNLYLKTKDLLLVRDYLNHKDAKVTQTYIDYESVYRDSHQI